MPAPYLLPPDYARFGLDPIGTTDAQVLEASLLVRSRVKRELSVAQYDFTIELNDQGYGYLPVTPVVSLVSARGRYMPTSNHHRRKTYNRMLEIQKLSLANDLVTLDGQPTWQDIPLSKIVIGDTLNPKTGAVHPPFGTWLSPFAEVNVVYTSGYPIIPDDIKMAITIITRELPLRPSANIQRQKEGDFELSFFKDSFIPAAAAALLEPYIMLFKA